MEELRAAIATLCAPVYLTSPSPVSETVVNLSDGSGLMSSKLSGCVNAPAEEVCVGGLEEGKGAAIGRPNRSQLMRLSRLGPSLVIENRRRAVFLERPQSCRGLLSSACENKLFNPRRWT